MSIRTGAGVVAVVAGIVALFVYSRIERPETAAGNEAVLSIAQILAAAAEADFPRVPDPHRFSFPADHIQHSDYRTEWWSLSAALRTPDGKALGLQVLLLRLGLRPRPAERKSGWAASELFAGLASISDPQREAVVTDQRLSRGALALAGSALQPVRVWIEDWRLEAVGADDAAIDLQGQLAIGSVALELQLASRLPLIDTNAIAGQSAGQGTPFQFYLQPRLQVSGTLRTSAGRLDVTGSAALEHAWGELPLPGGPVARDRMTLWLDDGRVLMIVVTHRVDGTSAPLPGGLLVDANGRARILQPESLLLEAVATWRSPRTGARYPIAWALQIPEQNLDLELISDAEDQEGTEWAAFWAGPVNVRDRRAGAIGTGFVQLYGYDAR